MGGLLVYGEDAYMEGWQVSLALGGCAVILLGIGVGQMRFGGPNPQQQSALPAIEERRPEASDRGRPTPPHTHPV